MRAIVFDIAIPLNPKIIDHDALFDITRNKHRAVGHGYTFLHIRSKHSGKGPVSMADCSVLISRYVKQETSLKKDNCRRLISVLQ